MKEGPPILAVLPPQADSVLPNDMESSTNILVTPNPVVNGTIYPVIFTLLINLLVNMYLPLRFLWVPEK